MGFRHFIEFEANSCYMPVSYLKSMLAYVQHINIIVPELNEIVKAVIICCSFIFYLKAERSFATLFGASLFKIDT